MKKFYTWLLALVLSVTGVACSNVASNPAQSESADKITVEHSLGKTEVPKNPQKVVVFDYGILDSLDKLGIEPKALPKSSNLPDYLSKYKDDKYVNVGSLKEPDFEKLSEIEPDLIIISGRQQNLYKEFEEIAPTIFMGIDFNDYMGSFEKNMQILGKIFGKENEIQQELTAIKNTIGELNKKAKESGKNALVIMANDNKISAFGPKSRYGLIHDVFGMAPADDQIEASTHGQSISFEYILEKNPDFLYVVDRSAAVENKAVAKQTVENELVKKTKAYQEGNIVYLDPNLWYLSGGGLQSVSKMAQEVEKSIQ